MRRDSYRPAKALRRSYGWLLFCGALTTQVSLASTSQVEANLPQMKMSDDGGQYVSGIYYLVASPADAVKASLEKGFDRAGLSGFQWEDTSAALSTLESDWVPIALARHPSVQNNLNQKLSRDATKVLARALAEGTITSGELAQFQESILHQREYESDDVKDVPLFSQRISRWRFSRTTGSSKAFDDFGVVMDVSSILDRGPTTLVWFGGRERITTRKLRLSSCMVGVTCFPDPHIERNETVDVKINPAMASVIGKVASDMHVLPMAEVMEALRAPIVSDGPVQVPKRASAVAPLQDAVSFDLPADEASFRHYDNDGWRMMALPDGSMLTSGTPTTHRLSLNAGTLRRQSTAPYFPAAAGLKLDPDGTVWGMTYGQALLSWRADKTKAVLHALPGFSDRVIDDWVVNPGHGAGLRSGDKVYSIPVQGGGLQLHTWNAALRKAAVDTQEHTMSGVWSSTIHFDDGLLWQADRDGYGISPATARVARTVSTRVKDLVFGSQDGHWGLSRMTDSGDRAFRIVDLESGLPRWDLDTPTVNYPSGLARTAHGRLLATSNDDDSGASPVAVFDMHTGVPVANVRIPKEFRVAAIAFTFKGDALWMYLEKSGSDSRKVLVWQVPELLRDPASGGSLPGQLRCTVPTCK